MVSSREIEASNALITDATTPRIAVFVGGTSGIGMLTIRALVATGTNVRIYLVGRKSAEERMHSFIQDLQLINPNAHLIWIEGGVALLSESKKVCEIVKSKESRIDLLFLSAGYAPFGTRSETTEGVEITQSLEYYSRVLFILHLLPLLRGAEAPRVISVLGGGLERATVDLDDMDLKKPGNFGMMKAQMQYTAMNTTTLDKLAHENPTVTFIHSWPGWVNTGNVQRGLSEPSSVMGWFVWLVLEPLIRLLSYSDEESGQRHLFQCTSAAFGGRGVLWKGTPGRNLPGNAADGLFLVNYKCDCTPNAKVISWLRENAQEKIWNHTKEVLRSYL